MKTLPGQRAFFLGFMVLFVSCTTLSGQIRFGLRAGLTTTDIQVADLRLLDQGGGERLNLALEDANYGIQLGVVIQTQINKFIFQPEVLFNSNSVDYRVTDLLSPGTTGEVLREKFNYLDIPVLMGFRFGPLRLQAGPSGHVFLNSSSDLFKFNEYDQTFQDLTVGWIGGAGLDIWNLMLDVRYEGNFNKFGDYIRFAGREYAFDDRPSRWIFSLGIRFGK